MMGWLWHQLNHMQAICTSFQHISTPAPHQSDFYVCDEKGSVVWVPPFPFQNPGWVETGVEWKSVSFFQVQPPFPNMFFTNSYRSPKTRATTPTMFYKLHQRAHDLTLPFDVNSTAKQNCIFRMLFDDMYWTVVFRMCRVWFILCKSFCMLYF